MPNSLESQVNISWINNTQPWMAEAVWAVIDSNQDAVAQTLQTSNWNENQVQENQTSIRELNFITRLRNILLANNIDTIWKLVECTEKYIRSIWIWPKQLHNIKSELERFWLSLQWSVEKNQDYNRRVLQVIESSDISTRIINILAANDIRSIDELTQKSEAELNALTGFWKKWLREVKTALGKLNLTLK